MDKLRSALLSQKRETYDKVLSENGIQTESQLQEAMALYAKLHGAGITTPDHFGLFQGINSLSAGTVGKIIGYLRGAVVFAFLLNWASAKQGNNKRTFRTYLYRICLASAWFWPTIFIYKVYEGFSYPMNNLFAILYDALNGGLSFYVALPLCITVFLWLFVKYMWLKFIVHNSLPLAKATFVFV